MIGKINGVSIASTGSQTIDQVLTSGNVTDKSITFDNGVDYETDLTGDEIRLSNWTFDGDNQIHLNLNDGIRVINQNIASASLSLIHIKASGDEIFYSDNNSGTSLKVRKIDNEYPIFNLPAKITGDYTLATLSDIPTIDQVLPEVLIYSVSQTSTNQPVANKVYGTLSPDILSVRESVGYYYLVFDNSGTLNWDLNKVFISTNAGDISDAGGSSIKNSIFGTRVDLVTSAYGSILSDGILAPGFELKIKIEIYP